MRRRSELANLKDFFTIGQAATVIGVSPASLRNWDRAGKLSPLRHPLNGYRLYRRCDLEAILGALANAAGPKRSTRRR